MRLLTKPLSVGYHADIFSCAACCSGCALLVLLIVPYFIGYYTYGFWRSEAYAREQPRVRFQHEALVEGHIGAGANASSFAWSTSVPLNVALGLRFRSCELRSWSDDDNNDGRPDALHFALHVPLDAAASEQVYSISLMVGLSYVADDNKHAKLEMNGTILASYASPLPGRRWLQRSELVLHTQKPLPARNRGPPLACQPYFWMFENPVEVDGSAATAETILARYHQRCNDTIHTTDMHPALWTAGSDAAFDAQLSMIVPHGQIFYTPTGIEVLKFAWIQYLACLIPLATLIGCTHAACIQYGVLATRAHNPLKPHGL